MCSAYRLNNRQTKTSSFDRPEATRIGPEEPLKNVRQIARRDSRTGIGDFQLSLPVRYIYPDRDSPTFWRVLDRVIQKIHHHLPEADTIAFDLHSPLRFCREHDALFVSQWNHLIRDGRDEVCQI